MTSSARRLLVPALLSLIGSGLVLVTPVVTGIAHADACTWATPTSTVLHGESFPLQLSAGCAAGTTLTIAGHVVGFAPVDPDDPLTFDVNTTELDDSTYAFATVEPGVDASVLAPPTTFIVNNTPPSVTVTSVTDGDGSSLTPSSTGQAPKVSGVIQLVVDAETAGVNDASIASVQALDPVTGDPIATVSAAPWDLPVDTTGWTNGPTDFTVLANQDDGNQGSTTITLDVENPATTLSETVSPSTVAYGKTVKITGQLLTRTSSPIPLEGRSLSLYVEPIGSSALTLVTSALKTDSGGSVSYSFTPTAGGHYELAYAGEHASSESADGYATSSSPLRPLTVTSAIAFRLTSVKQERGHAFSGFIATTPGTAKVAFQIQWLVGGVWKTISSPKTTGAKTPLSFSLPSAGRWQTRVVLAPSAPTVATSNYIALTVT